MTAVKVLFAGNAVVSCFYTYDDQTLLIASLSGENSDSQSHVVRLEVLDPVTFVPKFTATRTLAAGSTSSFNVSTFNVLMVDRVAKNGVHYLGFPFILGCAIG